MQYLVWFYGVFWQGSDGGSFSMMRGGKMYDLKLGQINHALVKAIRLLVATRLLVGRKSQTYDDLMDIEREVREAAAECQRVLALIDEDAKRPLISG